MVKTLSGIEISSGYERIVHGGRGDYVEISEEDMLMRNVRIPTSMLWRATYTECYYLHYTTSDGTKIYYQRRTVKYADYKIGYFYVSVNDVML